MSNFDDERKMSKANIKFNQINRRRKGTFAIFTIICLFMASLGGMFTILVMKSNAQNEEYYFNSEEIGEFELSEEKSEELQDVAIKTIKSVVSIINVINNQNYTKEVNVGVGIVLDSRGYVICNYSNLVNGTSIKVKSYNDTVYEASLIGFDTVYDIAMLEVENNNLVPITIAKSPINLNNGDKIVSVGNPIGKAYNEIFEVGTILSDNETIMFRSSQSKVSELLKMIKTTIPPKYINTGAALCNTKGELIGVNNTNMVYHSDYLKNSFYISVEDLKQITENILDKQDSMITYMGIYGEAAVSQQKNGIQGVYTKEVTKNGLAYEAGIRPTDIITQVNGMPVSGVGEINDILNQLKVGTNVEFTIYKNGVYSIFTVKIPEGKK